jgi:aminoglycoside phosphotransferase family enzyme/predicted kinase
MRELKASSMERHSSINHQDAVAAALSDPAIYPHPVNTLRVEETHISKVFLTGSYVYKIKKPVDLGFLDFTTLKKRHHYCQQEVQLNQRLSEEVYLDVVAITQGSDGYALDGDGEPVEYAVKMRQLPDGRTMLKLVRRGELSADMVQGLVGILARFYKDAEKGPEIDAMGSRESIWVNIEEDFVQTNPFVSTILDQVKFSAMHRWVRTFLNARAEIFDQRIENGYIRDCHGDLRLGHIYFADGIQIIDCIEFNERFRYGDVAADLAFLAMDLDFNGFPDIGQSLIADYAASANDPEIFLLLDFYKCYRAHVRCKVECLRSGEEDLPKRQANVAEERAKLYFQLAYEYALNFNRQTLWIVCGLSGSGKSTIAAELVKCFKVRCHRSDVVRKKLFDLDPEQPVVTAFGESIYTVAATDKTYDQLLSEARKDLSRGRSVILDATFGKKAHRDLARELSGEMEANIVFLECHCPYSLLRQRLSAREGQKSTSDARLEHLEYQRQTFEPLSEVPENSHLRLNTDQALEQCVQQILSGWYVLQRQQAGVMQKGME